MPSAKYYRTQARLLTQWGGLARDPATAEQLNKRASEMNELAEANDREKGDSCEASSSLASLGKRRSRPLLSSK